MLSAPRPAERQASRSRNARIWHRRTRNFRARIKQLTFGVVDRLYRPNMPLEEGIELMKKVCDEINTRFLVGGCTFTLKLVDKNGVRTLDRPSDSMLS